MIDTLRLNLVDCEIKSNSPLQIVPGIINHCSGEIINEFDLFVNCDGKIVRGNKAYLNEDKFNITINPTVKPITDELTGLTHLQKINFSRMQNYQKEFFGEDIGIEDEVKGVFVSASLPRLISKNNYNSLTIDEQKTALKELENLLKNNGIKTNIYNANLSRVDTFTNVFTDYSFFSYSTLFSLMECSRMKSIDWNDESFLWKNKEQELMIYDKVKEIKFKNPKTSFRTKKNIMRFENRLLKKRKIKSSLNFETLGEIYNNYDELKYFHKKEVENKIFKYDVEEIEHLTQNSLENKFRMFKKHYGKSWLRNYFFGYGIYSIMSLTSEDDLFEIIENIEGNEGVKSRVRKSRLKKEIRRYKLFFKLAENKEKQKISNIDLYNELKTKFYKLAA